mmetsp:Transcript_31262/g.58286  ORF Transcript_31262/g.58286 Transcript_31262/m.58286 type:complete len:245 (-) Transcript_31262:104-838(-)
MGCDQRQLCPGTIRGTGEDHERDVARQHLPVDLRRGRVVVRTSHPHHYGHHHGWLRVYARLRRPRLGSVHLLPASTVHRQIQAWRPQRSYGRVDHRCPDRRFRHLPRRERAEEQVQDEPQRSCRGAPQDPAHQAWNQALDKRVVGNCAAHQLLRRLGHGLGVVSAVRVRPHHPLLLRHLLRWTAHSPGNARRARLQEEVRQRLGHVLLDCALAHSPFRVLDRPSTPSAQHAPGRSPFYWGLYKL